MRTIVLRGASSYERKEEMGNAPGLFQQSFPSIDPGILKLLPSAGFWNTPYMKSTAKAKLPSAQLILAAEEVTAGARRQKIPQSLLEASVDPIKGRGLLSTGDQPPHLVESKQSSWQEKKISSFHLYRFEMDSFSLSPSLCSK